MLTKSKRLYLVPVLSKALDILELLQTEHLPISLEAIHRETKIPKTTAYRLLQTFVHRGYISYSQNGLYRQLARSRKLRFGFGGQGVDTPFSAEVTESLKLAAASAGVDLLILDNGSDPATALRNAEQFINSRLDLVIEFQLAQEIAPIIADKIAAAKIPLIAIDIPHPHATYFGVDNYRSGFMAGQTLAAYALKAWDGKVEWIVGLDLSAAGLPAQSRIAGAFEALRSGIPHLSMESFLLIDGRGTRDASRKRIADFLQLHPNDRHILITAANDVSALGALDAVFQHKREKHVAIVGHGCVPEVIAAMRRAGSPLIGSVSHEARSYGPSLIGLGLAILREDLVPPYNCVKHKMITPDSLGTPKLAVAAADSLGNVAAVAVA